MSGAGKPLHFLGWVLGCWVALRVGLATLPMLVPQPDGPEEASPEAERKRPAIAARPDRNTSMPPAALSRGPGQDRAQDAPRSNRPFPMPGTATPLQTTSGTATALPASFSPSRQPAPQDPTDTPAPTVVASLPAAAKTTSRWSLTGWMLWRHEASPSLAQAPLLGGSQGGIRLDYRLWSQDTRSLALYGRLTRALERPFAEEAALGIVLRPVKGVPVSLMAERRQKLGAGGRTGFAFLAAGGIGPRLVAPRLEIEGYAQAGVVTTPDALGFGDGRLALTYRLTPRSGPDLALGLGVSGGAQPGAARLDIGPELRLRLPVAGGHVRLSAEWRQRIAGAARPASGPAIGLVADF